MNTVNKEDEFAQYSSEGLAAVAEEMASQFVKWGEQNHPSFADDAPFSAGLGRELSIEYENDHTYGEVAKSYRGLAEDYQRINDFREENRLQRWDSILLEEVFEALAEDDPRARIKELIQVAAVAIQFAKSIERNELDG